LRNRFVNESNVAWKNRFLLQTPKHVREGAIKDLSQAFAVNFKVKKKNSNHHFFIRFRKKKDVQSIVIPKTYFKILDNGTATFYPKMLTSKGFFKMTSMPTSDCRLSTDRLGRWILYVPTEVPICCPAENQSGVPKVCSVDPGVRTFLTTWSTNEEAYKLGDGDSTTIFGMLLRIDQLISKASKATGRSKWRMKRAINRLRQRFENVIKDLHYQCANFLTARYQAIIIPAFGSKRMSSKLGRRLATKTVRSMLGLSHYAFRQRLLEVAQRRGIRVIVTTEEYTSMTCSCCGHLHRNLGSSKVFKCPLCAHKIDRDLQGAFNIFLKYIYQHPGDVLWTSMMGEAPHA
jgi:putative transposase